MTNYVVLSRKMIGSYEVYMGGGSGERRGFMGWRWGFWEILFDLGYKR